MKVPLISAAGLVVFGLVGWMGCAQSKTENPPKTESLPNGSIPMNEPTNKTTPPAPEGLVVRLSAEGSSRSGGPIRIKMIVSNPTLEPRSFCKYHTAFEGLRNDIFTIEASGQALEYTGAMAKRGPPGPKDYIRLGPGESTEAIIDLSEGYTIRGGVYDVTYRATPVSGLGSSDPLRLVVEP